MITLHSGMDDHSLEIKREEVHVGYVQWHPNRPPHVTITRAFDYLTLDELEQVLAGYEAQRARSLSPAPKPT